MLNKRGIESVTVEVSPSRQDVPSARLDVHGDFPLS
jgi:hypothetical protein